VSAQIAERLIRRSCRRLPAEARDERYREWAAEIPAILEDPGIRPAILRRARALSYALGIWKCTHHPQLTAGRQGRNARQSAVIRVTRGLGIYLGVVALFIVFSRVFLEHGLLPPILVVLLAVCFDGLCLADLARADQVRYLPKWGWALACLVQSPFGGIMYLSAGRVRS
jgi:hypothetical protein